MVPNHALRNVVSEYHTHARTPATARSPCEIRAPARSMTTWLSMPELRRLLLGALMHGLLYMVFRFPDVDLALSYAILGSDHGALLVLGRTRRGFNSLADGMTF